MKYMELENLEYKVMCGGKVIEAKFILDASTKCEISKGEIDKYIEMSDKNRLDYNKKQKICLVGDIVPIKFEIGRNYHTYTKEEFEKLLNKLNENDKNNQD